MRVEAPGGEGDATTLNPMMAGLSVASGGAQDAQQQPPQREMRTQLSLGSVGVAGVLKREERRAAETEQ